MIDPGTHDTSSEKLPTRSASQRQTALARANAIRVQRAGLKRDLKSGERLQIANISKAFGGVDALKDVSLREALDLLRAGGDLSKLSAPPEGIVVTEPGSEPKPDATPTDEPETPDEP